MFIEKLKESKFQEKGKLFKWELDKQLVSLNFWDEWELSCWREQSFKFINKKVGSQYIFVNVKPYSWEFKLKRGKGSIPAKEEATFITFPPSLYCAAGTWLSFSSDIVLWKEISFENIKAYYMGKLVCSIEWKIVDIKKLKGENKKFFEYLGEYFFFTKVKSNIYNVYCFSQNSILLKGRYSYTMKQIDLNKKTFHNSRGFGFIDTDGKHKYFAHNWTITDLPNMWNKMATQVVTLSKNNFYLIIFWEQQQIYFKNQQTNTLQPLSSTEHISDMRTLLNCSERLGENLFFSSGLSHVLDNQAKQGFFAQSKIIEEFTKNNIWQEQNALDDYLKIWQGIPDYRHYEWLLFQNNNGEIKLLDWIFSLITTNQDNFWFLRLRKDEQEISYLDIVQINMKGELLSATNMKRFRFNFDKSEWVCHCFFDGKTWKTLLAFIPKNVCELPKLYVFNNWSFKPIKAPSTCRFLLHFWTLLCLVSHSEISYIFNPTKETWEESQAISLVEATPFSLSQVQTQHLELNQPVFQNPKAIDLFLAGIWKENFVSSQELVLIQQPKYVRIETCWGEHENKGNLVFAMKEHKVLKQTPELKSPAFITTNFSSNFQWMNKPYVLSIRSTSSEDRDILMINETTLVNVRWKTLPL